jgi:Domain of unknown function (DUF4440)/Domain of unknown function (DUF3471)
MRLIVIPLLCLAICPSAHAQSLAKDAIELRRLTEQRFEHAVTSDRKFYERLLADNFLILDGTRTPLTKQAYLNEEFPEQAPGRKGPATITDFRAVVKGDTATVSYHVVETTVLGEQKYESRSMRLDTYVRIDRRWRLLSMAAAEPPSWPDVATVDPAVYADYVGTYRMSPTTMIVVTNEGGHLMAAVTGQAKVELFPENATTFFDRTDSPFARTVFERDALGKVVAQIYRAHGQRVRAVKVK